MRARVPLMFAIGLIASWAHCQEPLDHSFDAAPFGMPLDGEQGLMWEDPREIHAIIVDFGDAIPANAKLRVEYWGSHWPKEHLSKNSEPGGGDNGWIELGNWYTGGWRVADTEQTVSGNSVC